MAQTKLIERDPREAGAIFSPDRKYRYKLWRTWDPSKPVCAFIMLNPSTADEYELDPTVRRCVNYAKKWGYGGLVVGNIFALKSTNPKALYRETDPVGPDNNCHLWEISHNAAFTIVAWGAHGALLNRGKEVLRLIPEAQCLKMTKDGHPQHPLYLKGDLIPFPIS